MGRTSRTGGIAWSPERHFPRFMQELVLAVEDLHDAGVPSVSTSLLSVGGPKSDSHEPAGVRFTPERTNGGGGRLHVNRHRWHYDRIQRKLERLTEEIETVTRYPDSRPGSRRGRCPVCHRGQRAGARYCDGCGAKLVEEG